MKKITMWIAGLMVSGWAVTASALQIKDYDPAAMAEAMAAGGTVVLDFHAPWCGTCKKQASALESLAGDAALENVTVFKVNFDSAKDLKTEWKVKKQSTLVVVGADGEIARSIGETNPEKIRSLLVKAE